MVNSVEEKYRILVKKKVKLYPLYAVEAQGGRGGIAPAHT
jgi:hypothetical protein